MEDVIEERAIIKLCGYVLCSNQLTVVIRQQYHISTRKNKVYDISKRKNFCSSSCYGAANYLLEQMLESPLWMRTKEDIPVFQILPRNSKAMQCGDEIDIAGIKHLQDIDNNDNSEESECNATEQTKENATRSISSPEKNDTDNFHFYNASEKDNKVEEISMKTQDLLDYKLHSPEFCNQESENLEESPYNNYDNNIQKVDDLENLEIEITGQSKNILHLHKHNENAGNESENVYNNDALQSQWNEIISDQNDTSERLQSVEINDSKADENKEKLELQLNKEKVIQSETNKACKSNNVVISSASMHDKDRKIRKDKINKNKKYKSKKDNNVEVQSNIIIHVEQSVREWVTKNTVCLLMGETDERNQLLEKLTQYDRYQQLCKKLNRLQMEDEKEDSVKLERNKLKPLPQFSMLQEDGKKLELKVRAFYEGRMTFTSEDDVKESNDSNESILPLTDSRAPKALRRRIFLDNLNKILPDLMRTLTATANISSLAQCTYNNERYSLIKILISTFNLSATNIVFKTAEWTIVGLIIIKMLSLIDTQLQLLLQSKQALMYMSMILTTYKLDANYLDRFIMEVINNVDTSKVKDNAN